jgi:hypothetical protein
LRRITFSPTLSQRNFNPETASYTDDDSIDIDEVENTLNVDEEIDDTEDMVTRWSGSGPAASPSASTFSSMPGSYSTFSPGYTSASTGFPFSAGRILSMITERTEQSSSRPVSRVPRPEHPPESFRRTAGASPFAHGRSSTEPGGDRGLPVQGRRAGDLIAFFEEKRADTGSPSGHSRTVSAPGGPRSPSPYFTTASQSTPNFGSTTGYGTGYGYGSTDYGYGSRSSSPAKSKTGSSGSSASSASVPISTLLSPPLRGLTTPSAPETRTDTRTYETRSPFTSTFTNTFTNTYTNTLTPTNTFTGPATITGTMTGSPLRRPQTSPRSPLTSVRNIVAAWKERTPSIVKQTGKSTAQASATSASPPPGDGEGLFGIRRQADRASARLRESRSVDAVDDASIDMTDLMPYTKGNAKVCCLIWNPMPIISDNSCLSLIVLDYFGTSMSTPPHLTGGNDARPCFTQICFSFLGLLPEVDGGLSLLIF